jgi:hypothetical protein
MYSLRTLPSAVLPDFLVVRTAFSQAVNGMIVGTITDVSGVVSGTKVTSTESQYTYRTYGPNEYIGNLIIPGLTTRARKILAFLPPSNEPDNPAIQANSYFACFPRKKKNYQIDVTNTPEFSNHHVLIIMPGHPLLAKERTAYVQ